MKATDRITSLPENRDRFSVSDLKNMAIDIRRQIIDVLSGNSGHFGASMGAVELTLALHKVFKTPYDQIIWDVGHQAYAHKIITGRAAEFPKIREKGGISGFLKMSESEFDTFGAGHSSTSISAALGMAEASLIKGEDRKHIAVIGDGALTAGMAFEALNNAAVSSANLIIVINDNGMSIDPNVGGLDRHLQTIKPYQNLFTELGLSYSGPFNGHDLDLLVSEFSKKKYQTGVHVIHLKTQKGRGYEPAERGDPTVWHAPGLFDKETGIRAPKEELLPPRYQDVFGKTLIELAELDPRVVGITPAMSTGSGMNEFALKFPGRFFDVGIAEQHAVTFSAGIAKNGMVPFCNIYSTFLQRAYDQVIHDVALQNLHVVFCLDRAGLAGNDGATHHGAFDMAFLNTIPNLTLWAPMNELQLRDMMRAAIDINGPVVIRYPRGRGVHLDWQLPFRKIESGEGRILSENGRVAILSLGHVGNFAHELRVRGIDVSHYDIRCLKPLDDHLLKRAFTQHEHIITIEDGALKGGFASVVTEWKNQNGFHQKVHSLGIPDRFIEHGTQEELYSECGFDIDSLEALVLKLS